MDCLATCAFGLEAIVRRELEALNIDVLATENGRVRFSYTPENLVRANVHLRVAERVFLVLGEQASVTTYDALFDFVRHLDFAGWFHPNDRFVMLANSVKSTLYSPRDMQSIGKKALVDNMKASTSRQALPENGPTRTLTLSLRENHAALLLDTTGDPLHKRGYRVRQGDAPLRETLAAALVSLSFYGPSRVLHDPFCGSGTIAIEAAMQAKRIAPGLNRAFAFETLPRIKPTVLKNVRRAALRAIDHDFAPRIIATDIDPKMIAIAKKNSEEAGVDDAIVFHVGDVHAQRFEDYAIIITNPPYGERLAEREEAEALHDSLGKMMARHKTCSFYVYTALPGAEKRFDKKADRTRVLFNGPIKARYYQYYGPKPGT